MNVRCKYKSIDIIYYHYHTSNPLLTPFNILRDKFNIPQNST